MRRIDLWPFCLLYQTQSPDSREPCFPAYTHTCKMKAPFEKLGAFLAGIAHPKQKAKNADSHQTTENDDKADNLHMRKSYPHEGLDDPDGGSYAALSEIAAPEPVERNSEEELARRPSLEQPLSPKAHSSADHGNGCEALCEVAEPVPVERQ